MKSLRIAVVSLILFVTVANAVRAGSELEGMAKESTRKTLPPPPGISPLPEIISPLTGSGRVLESFTYTIQSNMIPATYGATGLPAGLFLNPDTGVITGYPDEEGTSNVALSATSGDLTGTATLVLTFGYPTEITSSSNVTALLNQPFVYQISASHQPESFGGTDLPDGLTVNTTTGLISGTPTRGGTYTSTITANGSFGNDSRPLIIQLLLDTAVRTLHAFEGKDGYEPSGGVIQATDGCFYGTTQGDSQYPGTVFKVTPDGTATTLHTFSSSDGVPHTGVIQAKDGNFYGTTGTNNSAGMIFKVTPTGVFTTLASYPQSRPLGGPALTGLVQGTDGNLYGSNAADGLRIGLDGTVTTLPGLGAAFTYLQASDGNLYAVGGGSGEGGAIFRINPDGTFTVIHSFGLEDATNSGVIQGSDGALYGTTGGGLSFHPAGSVYKVTLDGTFTTLHTLQDEGFSPTGLVQAKDGNIYGITNYGSTDPNTNAGTIFKVQPDGTFTTVHTFTGSDGGDPTGNLIQAQDGNLYGTSGSTIFETQFGAAPIDLSLPVVTLNDTTPVVVVGSGQTGVFTVTLSAPQTSDVLVNYTIKGSATNGTDYVRLKGSKKIKAGQTSKPIRVSPQGDLGGANYKVVKLTLSPGTGYTVGTTEKVKVFIIVIP